jgi:hypothetical protein
MLFRYRAVVVRRTKSIFVFQELYELNGLVLAGLSITSAHHLSEQDMTLTRLKRDMAQEVSYARGKRRNAQTGIQLRPPFVAPPLNRLHRRHLSDEIQHGEPVPVRQRPSRQVQQPRTVHRVRARQRTLETHQRERKQVLPLLVHLSRRVPDVRPDLEMVRRQRHELVVVWVEHDVAAEIDELDQVLFPRLGPLVGAHARDDRASDGEGGLGEAENEVVVELAPGRGKVECAPAAWDLREVGGGGVGERRGAEERARVEGLAACRTELDDFLLVEADPEEL